MKQLALEGLRDSIDLMVPLVKQVMKQTRARIFKGETRSEGKILSLFEPSTEIIRKGKAGKPNEFGKMVKLQEAENQIVIDYEVYDRRPSDSDILIAAIEAHQAGLGRAHRIWSLQILGSTPPKTKRQRKPKASNAYAFPAAPPKASCGNASRKSAGSVAVRNGERDARGESAWPSGDMGSTAADTRATPG